MTEWKTVVRLRPIRLSMSIGASMRSRLSGCAAKRGVSTLGEQGGAHAWSTAETDPLTAPSLNRARVGLR